MINTKLLVVTLFLAVISSNVQALAYPTKANLKKADHVVSLATTAVVVVGAMTSTTSSLRDPIFMVALVSMGANVIVNSMALKYEKKSASVLKLSLPLAGLFGALNAYNNDENKKRWQTMLISALIANGIKNIWDLYSLVYYNQSEGVQHD